MKVFCFSYAGGTAAFFESLEREAGDGLEFVKLEYAGHGKRHKEAFYQSFERLAADLYEQLKQQLKPEEAYAMFGYSMGTISVIEILRKILALGEIHPPVHVFLAAHEPYTQAYLADFADGLQDEQVKERTIQFGAVPEKLISNRSFWRVYLPIYRADYAMIGAYQFERLDLSTDIPATVLYSQTDTPFADMKGWSAYFTGDCQFIAYTGNHFFLQEHCREIAETMKRRLGSER